MVARKRKVLKGPCVGKVGVEVKFATGSAKDADRDPQTSEVKALFLENGLSTGRAQVVEGYVEDILRSCDEGPWYGEVLIAVPPFEVVEVLPGEEPWSLREGTGDDRECVARCREEQVRTARSEMSHSQGLRGTFLNENEERVMVVELHNKCGCPQEIWEKRDCGHPFLPNLCELCSSGYESDGTRSRVYSQL